MQDSKKDLILFRSINTYNLTYYPHNLYQELTIHTTYNP